MLGALTWLSLVGCSLIGQTLERPASANATHGWTIAPNAGLVVQKERHDCGPAALAMVLTQRGDTADIEDLSRVLAPTAESGVEAARLRDVARTHGYQAFLIAGTTRDLETELRAGRSVLVGLVRREQKDRAYGHYAVVVGMQPAQGRILVADPAEGWRDLPLATFEDEWELAQHLTLVVLRE